MLNKNTWGIKSAGPIRSNIANRQVRPKGLISAEAKKLLYQNVNFAEGKYEMTFAVYFSLIIKLNTLLPYKALLFLRMNILQSTNAQ